MSWRAIMGAEEGPSFPSHNSHNPQNAPAAPHCANSANIAKGSSAPDAPPAEVPALSDHARTLADRAQRAAAVHADRSGWDTEDWDAERMERAALASSTAGAIPEEWRQGWAALQVARPPAGFDARRWAEVIDDGGRFLDCWGPQAAALGWTAREVFGAHPGAPERRHDCRGLVLLLTGLRVVAITAESATIQVRPGVTQRAFRHTTSPEAVPLWALEGQAPSAGPDPA